MRRADLAKRLIDARTSRERAALLTNHRRIADDKLGEFIRRECYAAWTSEPARTRAAATAIKQLARQVGSRPLDAATKWVEGIAAISRGRFDIAAESLEDAYQLYRSINRDGDAAQVYVAKVLALAMLGRHDDAARSAKAALKVFIQKGDSLAAGKVELNLSNLVSRQGRHRQAEKHGVKALRHFAMTGKGAWLAMAENSLANTYAELNELDKAENHYKRALDLAKGRKMAVTVAEIEASLGNLYILKGNFDLALRSLELSREKYNRLDMPHHSAISELEMADIYVELNLWPEAEEIYSRVAAVFARLKMRGEEARSRLGNGRVGLLSSNPKRAARELAAARALYQREGNMAGDLATLLAWAELELTRGRPEAALEKLNAAAAMGSKNEYPRHRLELLLVQADIRLANQELKQAEHLLNRALDLSRELQDRDAEQRALTLSGVLARHQGETERAQKILSAAVDSVERLRGNISDSEYAPWFLSTRMRPYEELALACLEAKDVNKAFEATDLGRSGSLAVLSAGRKAPVRLTDRWLELRTGLNAQYKLLDTESQDEERLQSLIKKTERELAEVSRKIGGMRGPRSGASSRVSDLSALKEALGEGRTLIEFTLLDGQVGAFLVTSSHLEFIPDVCRISEVESLLVDLHFQMQTFRYGTAALRRFGKQLKGRTDDALARLGDTVLGKLITKLTTEKVVIVPSGHLFYIPFGALRYSGRYLIEDHELTVASSAYAWQMLKKGSRRQIRNTLLVGFADERIPLVEQEIASLASSLDNATALTGKHATFSAFIENLIGYDAIHVACHGRFRADNPMFSSLHLADGWVTVRDLLRARTSARLVTLSACETGLNQVNPGNEIVGLARGFFAAGASSLIMSLWNVNDDAAQKIMVELYKNLQLGASSVASLQMSLKNLALDDAHPYLWAPFVHIGA